MKKLAWIILILSLTLTVAACVGTANQPDTTAQATASATAPATTPPTPPETSPEASSDTDAETTAEALTEAPVDPKVQNAPLITPEAFMTPANEFRALNIEHGYPSGSIAERIQQLKDLGFGGVATNDPFTDSYLQDPVSLARVNEFMQALHADGLRVWLYDEKGYPSGSAGNLTCKDHPEYEAVRLTQVTVTGSGKGETTVALPDAFIQVESASLKTADGYIPAQVTVGEGSMTIQGAEGSWTAYVYCVTKYTMGFEWNGSYPNILNRDAIARFIAVTFDTYEGAVENFGDVIEAVFDDEAQLLAVHHIMPEGLTCPVIPYDYDIFDTFEQKYGYDLRPLLPLLYNETDNEAKRLRAQFYAHVGDLVSENFYGQIQAWCEAHGITLSGHLLLEEQMVYHVPVYGNYMQCSSRMGYAGFDVLSPRPVDYINSISTGGKYASSAAWLNGQRRVMVEIAPAADPDEFATNHLDYALGSMTFAYFDGGNQITSYYGQASSDYATGQRFNEYVGRLGSMTVDAVNQTEIAIYYSVDSVAGRYISPNSQNLYHTAASSRVHDEMISDLALLLRKEGLDYVFLDSASLQGGAAENGVLRVGSFGFKTIIVPKAEVMRIEDLRVLDTLIEQGCNVLFVSDMPSIAFEEKDQAELEALAEKHSAHLVKKTSRVVHDVTTKVALTVDSKQTVYVSPYEKDGAEFFFLANATGKNATATLAYEGAVGYRLYDPVSGQITEIGAEESCEIESYRALFVQPLLAE